MSMDAHERQAAHWFAVGETGESSKTMALWLGFESRYQNACHPYDPADFDRCLRLLAIAPTLRERLRDMRKVSKYWAALVRRWDEVEQCHLAEVGLGWTKARSAPMTYALMQQVYAGVGK